MMYPAPESKFTIPILIGLMLLVGFFLQAGLVSERVTIDSTFSVLVTLAGNLFVKAALK